MAGTTYRFYVNMTNASDQMSAVYGNSIASLSIDVPWCVQQRSKSLMERLWPQPRVFLGLPRIGGGHICHHRIGRACGHFRHCKRSRSLLVEDPNQIIVPFFLTDGATTLLSDSEIGSSWFVVNTDENGIPRMEACACSSCK